MSQVLTTALDLANKMPDSPLKDYVLFSLSSQADGLWQAKVQVFHELFNSPVGPKPLTDNNVGHMSDERIKLRIGLIAEELIELCDAAAVDLKISDGKFSMTTLSGVTRDAVEMVDACTDINYVVAGLAVEMGVDLNAPFNEVHASNMTKLGEDGKPIFRHDGKILKGPHYKRPQIDVVLGLKK